MKFEQRTSNQILLKRPAFWFDLFIYQITLYNTNLKESDSSSTWYPYALGHPDYAHLELAVFP